ncbi:MAG: short-chain dehydrogenase [Proteobacteria bacterium]|nr:MAG: short-chain dehydrogenase [Pseudomonadota bacterium]
MNIEDIEKFLAKNKEVNSNYVKISFRKRNDVYGLFVRDRDYDHLKSKNFWRVVTKTNMSEFNRTGELSLARIFNGSEFSRLTTYEENFA